jgi:hypothetical protein
MRGVPTARGWRWLAGASIGAASALAAATLDAVGDASPPAAAALPSRSAEESRADVPARGTDVSPVGPRLEDPSAAALEHRGAIAPLESQRVALGIRIGPGEDDAEAERALSELVAMFDGRALSRREWARAVDSRGSRLAPSVAAHLVAFANHSARTACERIVACELASHLRSGDRIEPAGAELPSAVHEVLRDAVAAQQGPSVQRAAASRSLAVLGRAADRAWLVEQLAFDDRRDDVQWALERAPCEDLALELARESIAPASRESRIAAIAALDRLMASHALAPPSATLVWTARNAATEVLKHRDLTLRAHLDAVKLLERCGGDPSREALLGLLSNPGARTSAIEAAARALLKFPDEPTANGLATVLARFGMSAEARLSAAEALTRSEFGGSEAAVAARQSAADHLRGVLRTEQNSLRRSRALVALARFGDSDDRRWFGELAAADYEDPAVRRAAERALHSRSSSRCVGR